MVATAVEVAGSVEAEVALSIPQKLLISQIEKVS